MLALIFWYFVSVGEDITQFKVWGPYPTQAECEANQTSWVYGEFGHALSSCFPRGE